MQDPAEKFKDSRQEPLSGVNEEIRTILRRFLPIDLEDELPLEGFGGKKSKAKEIPIRQDFNVNQTYRKPLHRPQEACLF